MRGSIVSHSETLREAANIEITPDRRDRVRAERSAALLLGASGAGAMAVLGLAVSVNLTAGAIALAATVIGLTLALRVA